MKDLKAGGLLAVWWLVFFLFGCCCAVYILWFVDSYGYSPTEILGGYHIFLALCMAVFFLPFMFKVHKKAKEEKRMGVGIAAKLLIGWMLLWMFATLIEIIKRL